MFSHEDCEYYVKENDGCLNYFLLGFFHVSQYDCCVESLIYEKYNDVLGGFNEH